MRKSILAACIALLAVTGARAQVNSEDLKWGPAPPAFPKGAQMAVLAGDPGKTGSFVVRLKMPAGYQIPAHHHPTTEYVTVISGEFHLGMGDKLDTKKGSALNVGGFAAAPAGMNHYAWAGTDAVVQVHAEGPFAIVYANPADDPTRAK